MDFIGAGFRLYVDLGQVDFTHLHLNPTVRKTGLHLNITDTDNALDYQLAFDVKEFFRLSKTQATQIYDEVLSSVKEWQTVAKNLGISRVEQAIKAEAFNV